MKVDSANVMQNVVSAIAQFNPEYPWQVRGCSALEIEKLQSLVGQQLPLSYRSFLSAMGHQMGGLTIRNADFSIKAVLKYYSRPRRWSPPQQYIFVGRALDDPYYDVYLDLQSEEDEPNVVQFPCGEPGEDFEETRRYYFNWVASSLREMVFTHAFVQYRIEKAPHHAGFGQSPGRAKGLEHADAFFRRLSFNRHPLSGPWTYCYEKEGVAATASQFGGYALSIELGANHRSEFMKTAELLRDHLHAVLL
jgi:hypothetical protein